MQQLVATPPSEKRCPCPGCVSRAASSCHRAAVDAAACNTSARRAWQRLDRSRTCAKQCGRCAAPLRCRWPTFRQPYARTWTFRSRCDARHAVMLTTEPYLCNSDAAASVHAHEQVQPSTSSLLLHSRLEASAQFVALFGAALNFTHEVPLC